MRSRGFEIVTAFAGEGIHIPVRKTASSAGYDIESAADMDIVPGKVTIIPTGLKAYMEADEYLGIYIRSSMSIKHFIFFIYITVIIDADYYNNEDNEGHIMVAVYNTGKEPFHVAKGDRVAQGIFQKYGKTDDDRAEGKRTGGVGSTGK